MCSCIQKVAFFQFMGQRINPDINLVRADDILPFFPIYAGYYFFC